MEWIKCSDKLPPDSPDKVLAYTSDNGIEAVCGDFVVDDYKYRDYYRTFTHWMKLPEPPQEVGTDE